MEGQHFRYSIQEFDAESLILYDPEYSVEGEGDEMGEFTQKNLQDQARGIHSEFDINNFVVYDPESSLGECNFVSYDPDLDEAESVSDDFQALVSVVNTVNTVVDNDNTPVDCMDEGNDNENDIILVNTRDYSEDSDTEADNVFEGRPRPGRKRKVPSQSRADRKRLLNTNKTHVNSRGKVYEEKIFDRNLECLCSKNCTQVVPLALRQRCFTQFWTSGSFPARAAYLITCLQKPTLVMKEAEEKEGEEQEVKIARDYAIYGIPVCAKMMLGTLQIDESRFNKAIEKYLVEKTLNDNRGKKSGGWNALAPSGTAAVRAHIASFPKYISHYTRGKSESKYLSSDLNLSKIYELYKAESENPASRSTYKKIFYTNFNLKFKKPKKDTCLKCDHYAVKKKTSIGADLQMVEEWHEAHLERAEFLQAQMKADCAAAKEDNELETLTFDMQKTLPLPKLSTSIAYYKRQLNLYNLGIHSGSNGKGKFNLWIESEASKGTQEVGSCLKQHIEGITKPMKKLILWSDSCGGQNRSIKFVLMMMYILENHATLETISMRYLLSGHSFLPNDTEFASAENSIKSKDNIFTDDEYIKLMNDCRIKNKFVVNRMSSQDFFSVKKLESLITNRKIDTNNTKVRWLDTHEIVIHKNQPGILHMRKEIGRASQTVNIQKSGRQLNLGNVVLDSLWPMGKSLSKEKIKDLQDMSGLVPSEHQYFYEFLNTAQAADFIDDIDGFGETIDFDANFED